MFKWILVVLFLGIVLGWLFPVEGPLDWTYDKYASQPAHYRPKKAPTRVAPVQKPVKEIIDLDEDDEPEWYLIIPKPSDTVGEPEE